MTHKYDHGGDGGEEEWGRTCCHQHYGRFDPMLTMGKVVPSLLTCQSGLKGGHLKFFEQYVFIV